MVCRLVWAIARDRLECGYAYVTEHDRALGQRSVEWTLAHTDRHSNASPTTPRQWPER